MAEMRKLREDMELLEKKNASLIKKCSDLERTANAATLRWERSKESKDIDDRARDGAVKKARILEHQLQEMMREVKNRNEERDQAVEKARTMEIQVKREREAKLHEMHLAFRKQTQMALAMDRECEVEAMYDAAERENEMVKCENGALQAAIRAHGAITREAVIDVGAQDRDIEKLQAQLLATREALLDTSSTIDALRNKNKLQSAEISRLRSLLLQQQQTNRRRTHSDRSAVYRSPRGRRRQQSSSSNAIAVSNDITAAATAALKAQAYHDLPTLRVAVSSKPL